MSTTRARATHVFISYSRANISFVQRLVADLQRSGITVWIDQSGLTPGTPDWETALRNAIGKAHAVILIASEEARKSPYVKDELRLAHDVHHLPIYPLWVAGTQWINCIPLGWGGTQYIDARGGEAQYQAALHQLIAVLSGANPVASLSPTSTLTHPATYTNQFPNYTPTPVGASYPIQTQPTRKGSRRTTATCLIATLVTLLLVGVLLFFDEGADPTRGTAALLACPPRRLRPHRWQAHCGTAVAVDMQVRERLRWRRARKWRDRPSIRCTTLLPARGA